MKKSGCMKVTAYAYENRQCLLACAVQTRGLLSLFFGSGQGREQQRRVTGDDRNHDQKLNEGKGLVMAAGHVRER